MQVTTGRAARSTGSNWRGNVCRSPHSMCLLFVAAVALVLLLFSTSANASQQSPTERMLLKRIAKLEKASKESRYQERVLLASVTQSLVQSGQAKIAVAEVIGELDCIRQLPAVDMSGVGIRVAHDHDIIDWRLAVIDNKCRGWVKAK